MTVFDTKNKNITAVIGESWNYPITYRPNKLIRSIRYLKGKTGALVNMVRQK